MPSKMPDTVTRNELATLFSISPQRVSQLAAAGVFRKGPDGGYLIEGAVPAYADFKAAAAAKRQRQDGMDGIKQRQLERLEAQMRREDTQLITMAEALEFGETMIAKFLEAYRSIPGRLEEGTELRKGLESAMPQYVEELESQLRGPMRALRTGPNIHGV